MPGILTWEIEKMRAAQIQLSSVPGSASLPLGGNSANLFDSMGPQRNQNSDLGSWAPRLIGAKKWRVEIKGNDFEVSPAWFIS